MNATCADVIIVNAQKPRFFAEGTTLRMVDLRTGTLKVSKTTSFEPGQVYSGGSLEIFNKFTRKYHSILANSGLALILVT